MGQRSVYLALESLGIEDPTYIMDSDHSQDLDLSGFRVHFHFCTLGSIGISRRDVAKSSLKVRTFVGRVVEDFCGQHLALRAKVDGPQEPSQFHAQPGLLRSILDKDKPVAQLEAFALGCLWDIEVRWCVARIFLHEFFQVFLDLIGKQFFGQFKDLAAQIVGGKDGCVAGHERAAAGMGSHIPGACPGICGIDEHFFRFNAQSLSHCLSQDGVESLPHLHTAVIDIHVSEIIHFEDQTTGV